MGLIDGAVRDTFGFTICIEGGLYSVEDTFLCRCVGIRNLVGGWLCRARLEAQSEDWKRDRSGWFIGTNFSLEHVAPYMACFIVLVKEVQMHFVSPSSVSSWGT